MNLIQAIVLGIVQGLTEFLPISSSAHVQIVSELLKIPGISDKNSATTAFVATIQLGTEAAVLLYFAKDIWRLLSAFCKGLFSSAVRKSQDFKMAMFVIIGSIPVGIVGYSFRHFIEETVRTLWVISVMLIVFGVVLLIADRVGSKSREIRELNVKTAIGFGLGQMLSVIPGVSRSGASISFGLLAGFTRTSAARFSFLIGIPAVLVSGLIEFNDSYKNLDSELMTGTLVATITSFIVGYLVIAGLLKYLNKGSFLPFVIWRITLGVAMLILLSTGLIVA
ncbi:MAG: undecaprenyl-diphosphate phosphatase [Actinomycetes bacterium]